MAASMSSGDISSFSTGRPAASSSARDVLQAEDVLVGRDEVEHLLVRRLRLRRARQRLDQVLLDPAEVDRLLGDLAQRDDGVLVVVAVDRSVPRRG